MEIRGIFWLTILCLASSVHRSRTENRTQIASVASERDDRDWRNNDEALPRRDGVPGRGIDESKIGCSRYCIQRKRISALEEAVVDSIKRVNIVWKIVNDSRVTFTGESSWGMSASQDKEPRWEPSRITLENGASFNDDEARCELYLQLGCGDRGKANASREIFDEYFDRELKSLASLDAAEGYTETAFEVDNFTEELRIFVPGKLSQATLEIPIAPRAHSADARGPRPTLSLSRTSDAKGVRLDARNPPSGGWRLKLLGMENSNYSLSVLAVAEKIIFTNSSANRVVKSISEPKESTEEIVKVVESIESSGSKEIAGKVEASRTSDTQSVAKFARQANLEAEIMEPEERAKILSGGSSGAAVRDENAKIENSELQELARGVEDGRTGPRRTVVDVHPSAELVARPGTFHVVVFTVTNNQALGIRHAFQARSTHFRIISVSPSLLWIQPGEEANVAVQIAVPNSQDAVPSTVTLYVGGSENFEVVEKSTYVYVQGPGVTTTDNAKPSIDYSFNDNCAGKLGRERCTRSRWSVEITVKDSDSGLKRVVSLPEGVEPRTQFIAGTKSSVNFYYISSCCYTTVDVTAIDVQGNTYKRTIDVTEWDNLSQGEIAAVVVGALLILLLIILIILIVVYCIRKRKSHDLSYSQRYGSRTPASAERTDF